MPGWSIVLVLVLTGCGRIDFGAIGDAGRVRDTDGDSDATADAALIPAGPLVWLKMDTGPAGGIIDSAGGHPAACDASCPALAGGVHGAGYTFASEIIGVVASGSDLDVATGFSGAVWLELTSLPPTINACPWSKQFDG